MDWKKIAQGAMSSFATGGIGLGLNAVGSVIGNALSRGRMDKQSDLEKSILKYQYDLYSPENQVARLRRAGLNVGLMYSGNGMQSGGATGSIGMSSSDPQAVGMNPLMVSEMETAESVQELNLAKADLTRYEALTEQSRKLGQDIDNAIKDLDRYIKEKSADSVIEEAKQVVDNLKSQKAKADQEIETLKKQGRWYDVQSDDMEQTRASRISLNESLKKLNDANADEKYSQSDLNVALRKLYEIQQDGAKIANYTAYITAISKQYELWYKQEYGSDIPSGGFQNAIQRAVTVLVGTERHYKDNYDTTPVSDHIGASINNFVSYMKREFSLPKVLAEKIWHDFKNVSKDSTEFIPPTNW